MMTYLFQEPEKLPSKYLFLFCTSRLYFTYSTMLMGDSKKNVLDQAIQINIKIRKVASLEVNPKAHIYKATCDTAYRLQGNNLL